MSDTRHQFVDDPRNKLFYNFIEYVNFFKPTAFIMENVEGMKSYRSEDGASILEVISSEFTQIGYRVFYKLLNAADFGVPQSRKRFFFVGVKEGIQREYTFPEPTHSSYKILKTSGTGDSSLEIFFGLNEKQTKNLPRQITSIQALADLHLLRSKEQTIDYPFKYEESIQLLNLKFGNEGILVESSQEMENYLKWTHTSHLTKIRHKGPLTCHKSRFVSDINMKRFNLMTAEREITIKYSDLPVELKTLSNQGFKDKMRRLPWWRPSHTIVAHLQKDGYMFVHPDPVQTRSITVREAARLQSFPDSFDFSAGGEVAMTHQFRHVGNAVPPLLAYKLARSILAFFKKS